MTRGETGEPGKQMNEFVGKNPHRLGVVFMAFFIFFHLTFTISPDC